MPNVITDDQAKENLSRNIQRLLEQRGMSQSDLARETGENCVRISSVVRGQHLPTAGFLSRLAEALGTSMDTLLAKSKARRMAEAS